jgi:flagellar biosynthesis GTPase FlhF
MKETEKKTEVSVNVSSGAEKVESVAQENKRRKKPSERVKKKVKTERIKKRAQAESDAAKARVEKELKKKEEKAKYAAEKKARAEKKRAEKEKRIRERAHAKASRKQAQMRERARKKEEREEKHHRSSQKGYGGWIAAVVTLGVITLALSIIVMGYSELAPVKVLYWALGIYIFMLAVIAIVEFIRRRMKTGDFTEIKGSIFGTLSLDFIQKLYMFI